MFKISNKELDKLIHDLINIANILKLIEDGNLNAGQKKTLHNCELRLYELRDQFLKSIKETNDIKEE